MNESNLENSIKSLLAETAKITKQLEKGYRDNGTKYNIFNIAGIGEKEVIMCKVIADLLDPKGKHYKGTIYLNSFLEIISKKYNSYPAKLDDSGVIKVSTEYPTDQGRKIDIVIEDKSNFIPIEVKIWAEDQQEQIADYYAYSKERNDNKNIPVLYLTPNGHKPSENSSKDESEYKCISFKDDIIEWLKRCLENHGDNNSIPVREVIKQLKSAVESICGYMEDEDMKILEEIVENDATIQAALKIQKVMNDVNIKKKLWELFKILIGKKEELAHLKCKDNEDEEGEDEAWYYLDIPIKNEKYHLWVDCTWGMCLYLKNAATSKSDEANYLKEKIEKLTGLRTEDTKGFGKETIWVNTKNRYPVLKEIDDDAYHYALYKQYKDHPEEVANEILKIVEEIQK
ncbi:MAG: hypothetical protein Ta2G_17190 [Termitinemataceae bacterium]|nr:MAG: hypothetical protein Ta2G_17190 [Termitinemataceae bacterium]